MNTRGISSVAVRGAQTQPTLPDVPAPFRQRVAASTAELSRQPRPPFGILGREIDSVVSWGRGVGSWPNATWHHVGSLLASLERLRSAALHYISASDARIQRLDGYIREIRQVAARNGVAFTRASNGNYVAVRQ